MPSLAASNVPIEYEPGHGGALNVPLLGWSAPSVPGSSELPSDNSSDIIGGSTNDIVIETDAVNDTVDNYSAGASLAQIMKDNPGLGFEDYMKIMAEHSDEWAEKLIDYYAEKASWNETNAYNASREDTAYQRLTKDLKAAGLNPAMMYGGSASTSTSAASPLNISEGATYRGVSATQKMKNLILGLVALEWQIEHEELNDKFKGLDLIRKYIGTMILPSLFSNGG